jgi:hypothetical protein
MSDTTDPETQLLQAATAIQVAVMLKGRVARRYLLQYLLTDDMAKDIVSAGETWHRQKQNGYDPEVDLLLKTEAWELLEEAAATQLGFEV